MKSPKIKLITFLSNVFVLLLVGRQQISCTDHQSDCNFVNVDDNVPCNATYGLVRSINCVDGNSFDICCKLPIREDIQKSRQKWFRAVTLVGDLLSRACTKRIFCEQACLDGLQGSVTADYPQINADDTQANKDYVLAWYEGEDLSCFNLEPAQGQVVEKGGQPNAHTREKCKSDCADAYPECQPEIDRSFLIKVYYETARIFHRLGLWSFTVFHMVLDEINEIGKTKSLTVYLIIKTTFTKLVIRMKALESAFNIWLATEKLLRFFQFGTSLDLDQKWSQFLVIYNRTDPALVKIVHESLNHKQFTDAIVEINRALMGTEFGIGA